MSIFGYRRRRGDGRSAATAATEYAVAVVAGAGSGVSASGSNPRRAQLTALISAAIAAGLVVGCAQDSRPSLAAPGVGQSCVDDSPRCINERRLALASLMADTSRSWVRRPPTAAAYASGVRLFAFQQRKRVLTCDELAVGEREAGAAGRTLRGPAGLGLTPAQISRGAMLGEEVARSLGREARSRCRR